MSTPDAARARANDTEYYVLQCFSPLDADPAEIGRIPAIEGVESWMKGALIDAPIQEPIELELDPNEPGPMLEMYNLGMLILSERLVAALQDAGVDNLQVFRVGITDPATGERRTDYRAVNIVGCVAAADLNKSVWSSAGRRPIIDVEFDSLTIDPKRAGGFLLFRLAECISAIIIHASVRQSLLDAGFDMLTFMHPADFVG
jgi:hypothetical protein